MILGMRLPFAGLVSPGSLRYERQDRVRTTVGDLPGLGVAGKITDQDYVIPVHGGLQMRRICRWLICSYRTTMKSRHATARTPDSADQLAA